MLGRSDTRSSVTSGGTENGYCDFTAMQIAVRPDVSAAQAVKTLIHELGHALLHEDDHRGNRDRQEVEAESTAFVVLDALGLSSDGYSFPYVARWSDGNVELIKEVAERVAGCAGQIMKALEISAVEIAAPQGTDR